MPEIQRASAPSEGGSSLTDRILKWARGQSPSDVVFHGLGARLNLGRCVLSSPLVYHLSGRLPHVFDASLIEDGLEIARSSQRAEDLPYWPSFRDATPAQRCKYLEWLESERSQPDCELGYVFIYFYGLERRVVIDRQDQAVVIEEVLRLLSIYGRSRSFQRYATRLLWMALLNLLNVSQWSDRIIERVIAATNYWNEETLAAMLALYFLRGQALPESAAYIVAQHDARSPRSVVIRRHEEQFRKLFGARFQKRFGVAIPLKASQRPLLMNYGPASATLSSAAGGQAALRLEIPHVGGIPSQFAPLVEIWTSVIEELRDRDNSDRAHTFTDIRPENAVT